MAKIIPNEETVVLFCTTLTNPAAPTNAELIAGINLTAFIISINASTRGNIVQTPTLDNRFETSIAGTVTATFEADMYRDKTADTAWNTLPRNTSGWFVICRFGGTGGPATTPVRTLGFPITGNKVESWPVLVVARSATNLTNNTAQTFSLQCSVPSVPAENAVVAT